MVGAGGLGHHIVQCFGCVLAAGLEMSVATGGEQSSQDVSGSDHTPAAHEPGGGARVLGLLYLYRFSK